MASLPDYVTAAKPVPQEARAAWYRNTAQTYAGIMLWVVFWRFIVVKTPAFGGSLAAGVGVALIGVLVAVLCHFLTYLVPGLLGMKTGLPLYVVGTSTYGVRGGFIMPGFLMGCLQFGWLAVNACIACSLICESFGIGVDAAGKVSFSSPVYWIMGVVYILLAVGVGLKGIQYVAKVATFMPIIPLAILAILLVKTLPGLSGADFQTTLLNAHKTAAEKTQEKVGEAKTDEEKEKATEAADAAAAALIAAEEQVKSPGKQEYLRGLFSVTKGSGLFVMLILSAYIVGFFATAGAAGADFGMNNRDVNDVQLGGLVGIVGATFFAGGVAILVVAGAYGADMVSPERLGELDPVYLLPDLVGGADRTMLFLLAVASFAPACFPAFIAANSFRTVMPNFGMVAVGIGTLASVILTVTGFAADVISVFTIVGASFGPICGAMMADYLLSGRKWAGPRAGFNPAGWISWAVGFAVGAIDLLAENVSFLSGIGLGIPCPPMAALIVGFVLYIILAKAGMESEKLEMPGGDKE